MPGTVVVAHHTDSVLVTDERGLAVQVPAEVILAVDAVLTRCRREGSDLTVRCVRSSASPDPLWRAMVLRHDEDAADLEGPVAATPWAAVVALAKELETQGG